MLGRQWHTCTLNSPLIWFYLASVIDSQLHYRKRKWFTRIQSKQRFGVFGKFGLWTFDLLYFGVSIVRPFERWHFGCRCFHILAFGQLFGPLMVQSLQLLYMKLDHHTEEKELPSHGVPHPHVDGRPILSVVLALPHVRSVLRENSTISLAYSWFNLTVL